MKVRVLVAMKVWGRKKRLLRTRGALMVSSQHCGVEIVPVLGVSPGDPDGLVPEQFKGGISTPNQPLSNKSNALVLHAASLKWTHLLVLGSDDIVSKGFLAQYDYTLDAQGWTDLHMYETESDRLWYWPGYGPRRPESVGAGRMFSREAIKRLGWRLHEDGRTNDLDASTTRLCKDVGLEIAHIPLLGTGEYMVDCKDGLSVSRMDGFQNLRRAHVPADVEQWLRL